MDKKVREEYEQYFVTKVVKFRINAEISKLLVKPLYNGNISYAIRELLQNAVDACNQREQLDSTSNYLGKVIISINTKEQKIQIIDNGIGMNADALLNYYFTVGASYRYSENWKSLNVDENGNSKVIKTGKFGIGVLSTFLLGDKVKISTQYINDKRGYQAEFSLESTNIQLERIIRDSDFGTTIEINMNESSVEYFISNDEEIIDCLSLKFS